MATAFPPFLYKFCHPARAVALATRRIRFTQASATNDPFELRPYFEVVVEPAEVAHTVATAPIDWRAAVTEVHALLPVQFREATTPADLLRLIETHADLRSIEASARRDVAQEAHTLVEKSTPGLREQVVSFMQEHIGILSLTEDAFSTVMWGLYADSHRGFVLEFDTKHEWFHRARGPKDDLYHVRKVEYVAKGPPARTVEDVSPAFLVQKQEHWRHEREWRMLMPVDHACEHLAHEGDTVHLFEFPPEIVTRVVLGLQATEETRRAVDAALASWPTTARPPVVEAMLDSRHGEITIPGLVRQREEPPPKLLLPRATFAVLAMPGIVAGFMPWYLHLGIERWSLAIGRWSYFGLAIALLGLFLFAWTVRDFFVRGQGTLAPWDPPKFLVAGGAYRWCRNPMYVGVLLMIWGQGVWWRSGEVVAYGTAMAVIFHLRVVLGEEPWLARTFPEPWARYARTVRRWGLF